MPIVQKFHISWFQNIVSSLLVLYDSDFTGNRKSAVEAKSDENTGLQDSFGPKKAV